MAVLKCKMCGGDLQIEEGMTVCECEYCGSKQTVPVVDNEKKTNLYERANRLRYNCEFDKAETVYESIVGEFHEEAEAYWGLVLCKYGIEYVDDPATGKKVPTCHRSSFDSVMDDNDFELVMENSDTLARQVYREQAKEIEEIRKGIIEVSGKEEPYDIFICYKETAEDGQRTIDSVLAQDVYEALAGKGYRVFFSRITLEDKIGTEYEPYIFAALNSAKVMLAFGTTYDYYNAVWVKNEWSRFLKLMAADKTKYLIPCYKNIDAYDIPKEFAKLQAQDLGKVGAIQDLIRGIDKIIGKEIEKPQPVVNNNPLGAEAEALYKRGMFSLEDRDWSKAYDLFQSAIEKAPEMAEIYVGQAMLAKKCSSLEQLEKELLKKINNPKYEVHAVYIIENRDLQDAMSKYYVPNYLNKKQIKDNFSLDEKVNSAQEYFANELKDIQTYFEHDRNMSRAIKLSTGEGKSRLEALKKRVISEYEQKYKEELAKCDEIIAKKCDDKTTLVANAYQKIEEEMDKAIKEREQDYNTAVARLRKAKRPGDIYSICKVFERLENYEDSVQMYELGMELAEKKVKKQRTVRIVSAAILVAIIAMAIVTVTAIIPTYRYNKAVKLAQAEELEEAITIFKKIPNYGNTKEWLTVTQYNKAVKDIEKGDYEIAVEALKELDYFEDSHGWLQVASYELAQQYAVEQKFDEAIAIFVSLGDYSDAVKKVKLTKADKAGYFELNGEYDKAIEIYNELGYSTVEIEKNKLKAEANQAYSEGKYWEACKGYWEIGELDIARKILAEHEEIRGMMVDTLLQGKVTDELLDECYTYIQEMGEGPDKEKATSAYVAGRFNGTLSNAEVDAYYNMWKEMDDENKAYALTCSESLKAYTELVGTEWEATTTIRRRKYKYTLKFMDNAIAKYNSSRTDLDGRILCNNGQLAVMFGKTGAAYKLVLRNDKLSYQNNNYTRVK